MMLAPALTPLSGLDATLAAQGFAVLNAQGLGEMLSAPPEALATWPAYWDRLPADGYLRDGGRYRRRRHSCFIVEGEVVTQVPHRPHWQPVSYNALHGGIQRHFEPIEPARYLDPEAAAAGERAAKGRWRRPGFRSRSQWISSEHTVRLPSFTKVTSVAATVVSLPLSLEESDPHAASVSPSASARTGASVRVIRVMWCLSCA